tara:strand:- start:338 stop:625 length:288 start_codon:yes stop_codon:yes gene_type:complete
MDKRKEKYYNFVYEDMVKNTVEGRMGSGPVTHYFIFDCNISVHLDHRYRPPSFNWIPPCLSDVVMSKYGLKEKELLDFIWGRYQDYFINVKLGWG